MFRFDRKKIKQNGLLIIVLLFIVVILVISGFLLGKVENKTLKESDLDENGDSKINSLVINEIMSSNGGAASAPNGGIYDWIELYNGNDYDINLLNYGLSDEENKTKWVFPDVTIKAKSYMVVYLSGTKQEGLYANFKLSSSGKEIVSLRNKNGKVIDAIETVSLNKNQVMARNNEGNWIVTSSSTPGFINTEEGRTAYIESLKADINELEITEVLPNNAGHFTDQYGNYSGYIEIRNKTNKTISLKEYGLGGDVLAPFRWQFPNIQIGPNETKIIYTSGKNDTEKELHANFKLTSKNGVAILTKSGKIVDQITYTNLENGMALIKENKWIRSGKISPGYPNTTEGIESFSKKYLKNKEGLIINEIMNNNTSYLVQNGNEYYDWIEIKNNSKKEINLKDYYLSKNDNRLTEWNFPDITLSPGELYVVMASGDINLSNKSYKHTNFKLSETESLYITDGKNIIDSMFISEVPLEYSMGRGENYGFFYFSKPTPKEKNGTGILQVASKTEVHKAAGIYNNIDGINLEIEANGTIYYTLDGSVPSTKSSKYTGPIFLKKTTVVRSINVEEGKIDSPVTTSSYIINEGHTLPVMSVSMNPNDFKRVSSNSWTDLEVASYAEFYEDGKSFSIPCGFRLFGGSTRGMAKKSFSLKFKKKYGEASLHYPVFDNRDFSIFNTLVLRSGSQDSENAFLRDILTTSLMEDSEAEVQSYKSMILYINGEYWGVYNIREKVDDEFLSNHYNVDGSKGNITRTDYLVSLGTSKDYQNIVNYVSTHDMSKSSNYEYVKKRVNINSLIDFWVGEIYTTNNDIINSRVFSHPDIDHGKMHFIFYDLDYSMYFPENNYYTFMTNPEGMSDFKVPTTFMINMFKSQEFRNDFVERLSWNLKNIWNKEHVLERLDEIYNKLKPEMERNQKRWGMTMKDWEDSIKIVREFIEKREGYLLRQTKNFFRLSNSDMDKYFGDI
ncbi:MAG: hypothetical protein HFH09_04805 [Bacilli bacterium]|nr:hypothetical protein [Bacilli bacterium]